MAFITATLTVNDEQVHLNVSHILAVTSWSGETHIHAAIANSNGHPFVYEVRETVADITNRIAKVTSYG